MSEMVERVARALFNAEWKGYGPSFDERVTTDERDYWFGAARAAIAAMRDSTPAISDAALDAAHLPVEQMWRAMIDAALSDQSR